MSVDRETRDAQLGMPYSKARNRLIKALLFSMAHKLGMGNCFRCGSDIDDIDNFSIEHKVPWMYSDDPISLFYDIENVVFSHQTCNAGAARHPRRKSEEELAATRKERSRRSYAKRARTEETRMYQKEYHKNRYNSDPEFRSDRLERRRAYRQTGTSAHKGE